MNFGRSCGVDSSEDSEQESADFIVPESGSYSSPANEQLLLTNMPKHSKADSLSSDLNDLRVIDTAYGHGIISQQVFFMSLQRRQSSVVAPTDFTQQITSGTTKRRSVTEYR